MVTAVQYAFAAGSTEHGGADITTFMLELVVILVAAKLGGELFVRFKQPAVLGELLIGIIIGNIYLTGFHGLDMIRTDPSIKIISEVGIVLLLFQVGLESDVEKMMQTGKSALLVATLGVITPLALGWFVSSIFLPNESVYSHIFTGAALCATSVGITARVFMDLGKIDTPIARIVLGAAVIDDVMGLIILALVQGLITAASAGSSVSAMGIVIVILKALAFIVGTLLLGRPIAKRIFNVASKAQGSDLLLFTALIACFGFAYLASIIGLAPIVGAFSAGLVLDEVHWKKFADRGEHSVDELIAPIAAFLVPIFFIRMGSEVDLLSIAKPSSLLLALCLTIAAILGKQICGLGVMQKGLDRLSVGLGMIPRGEVGLIFAAIGSKLHIKGVPVVGPDLFAAIVIMVVVTTMVTPPLLKWSLSRNMPHNPDIA
jgi:Kef-type K+ transport system membrane component KefB